MENAEGSGERPRGGPGPSDFALSAQTPSAPASRRAFSWPTSSARLIASTSSAVGAILLGRALGGGSWLAAGWRCLDRGLAGACLK